MSSKSLPPESTAASPLNSSNTASSNASTVRVRPTPRVHRKAALNTNSTVKSTTSAGNIASASATPPLPPATAFVAPVPVATPPVIGAPTSSAASSASSTSTTTRSSVRFHSLRRKSSLTDPTASSSAKTVSGGSSDSSTNLSQHRHRSPSPSSRTGSRSDSPTRPRTPTTRITTTSIVTSPPVQPVTTASSATTTGPSVRSPSPIRPSSNSSTVRSSSPSRNAPKSVNSPPPPPAASAAVIPSTRSRSRSRSPTKDRRVASPSASSSSTIATRPRSPSPTKKPTSPPSSKAEPSVPSAAIVRAPSPTRIVMPATEKAPVSPKSPSTRKPITTRRTNQIVAAAEEDDEDDPTATVEPAESDEITEETDTTTLDDDNTAAENSVPNRRPVDVLDPLVEDLDFEPEESFTELERQRKRKLARLEATASNESGQSQPSPPQTTNASVLPVPSAVVHNNQTRTPVTTPLKQQSLLSTMKSTPLTPSSPLASDSGLKWQVPTPFNPAFLSTHYRPSEHDLYFAYGSNLNLARMRARRIEVIGGAGLSACLMNYRLVFNKTSESLGADCLKPGAIGYANILPTPNESVFGIVYIVRKTSLIPSTATSSSVILKGGLDGLDVYEGVEQQMYARQTVGVQLQDGSIVSATTYLACPEACSPTPDGLAPTQSYLNHLLAGHALLPVEYHAQIEKTPLSWMADPALAHHASHALEVSEPLTNYRQQSLPRSQEEQNGV